MTPEEYEAMTRGELEYTEVWRRLQDEAIEEVELQGAILHRPERKLTPGEGCALAVILALPMWAAIIGVGYWLFTLL